MSVIELSWTAKKYVAWNTHALFGNLSGSKKILDIFHWKDLWMKELKLKQVVCLLVQRLASSCPDICLACVKYACLRLVGTVLIDTRDGVPSNKTALIRETSTHAFGGKAPKQSSSILCYFKSQNLQNWVEATIILRFGSIIFTLKHLLFSLIGKPANSMWDLLSASQIGFTFGAKKSLAFRCQDRKLLLKK